MKKEKILEILKSYSEHLYAQRNYSGGKLIWFKNFKKVATELEVKFKNKNSKEISDEEMYCVDCSCNSCRNMQNEASKQE